MKTASPISFSTVDEYIALQPPSLREGLTLLRETIRMAAPEAEETISYQMPTFKFHGILVWFAAFKQHYGFFPKARAIEVFKEKLKPYKLSKGTVRFPLNEPLPLDLITEIVKFNREENLQKETLRGTKKKR